MNIARGLGRWFLSLAVAMMLTAWISFGVLQATFLNRTAVQGWLRDSGAYQNVLDLVKLQDTNQSLVTKADLTNAIKATFPSSYLQAQTEKVIDAVYDWIEGKSPTISFSIPIQEKRAEFSANLAKEVQPKIAALPQCKTRVNPDTTNPTCIPQGMNATDLAKQLSQLSDGGDFLNQPITADSFKGEVPAALPDWVPSGVASIKWLVVALPIGALVCAAGYVLLSDSKLKGLGTISRRVFLNGLVLTIAGIVIWQMGSSFKLSSIMTDSGAANLIDPLFQQVIPAVGRSLAAMGGALAAVGGIAWGTVIILKRRHQSGTHFESPHSLPKPPAAPPEGPPPTAGVTSQKE